MGKTIIGPTTQGFPSRAIPAVVQLKENWADEWTVVPQLEFLGGNVSSAAHDVGSCMLMHRHGLLKHPWEPVKGRKSPVSLDGCWACVSFAGQQGFQEAFIGRITGEVRTDYGQRQTEYGLIPTGSQCFEALGPLMMLRKIHVARSSWCINGVYPALDWVPPLNEKFGRTDKPSGTTGVALGSGPGAKALGSRSGNRYATPVPLHDLVEGEHTVEEGKYVGEVYVYGGTELWNYYQYADYILKLFVDETYRGDGPHWRLGGQADVLKNFTDPIEFGTTQTVESILRRLIRPDMGLDYKVVTTDEGFEVRVFVLTRKSTGWGGTTLPGNPDTVKVHTARSKDSIKTSVEKTSAQRYGTIRILGDRIVVCASLNSSLGYLSTLVKKWNAQDESDYKYLPDIDSTSPEICDQARRAEKYHDVYRKFGVSTYWYGTSYPGWRSPWWNGKGDPSKNNGPMQRHDRSTLAWLPLETGIDYSYKPYIDNNQSDITPTLRLPQVWFYTTEGGGRWVPADQIGLHVSVPRDDIGVFLHATPNHLLAAGRYGPFYGAKPSNIEPQWEYTKMVATVAYRTDQRIYCEQAIADAQPSDGVLEVEAPECQFWFLAPNTMIDIDSFGQPIVSASDKGAGMIVRNDWARMAAKMAGVLARYYQQRARAQIHVRGFLPWGGLIGQILTVIDEGGDLQTIESPITDVRWIGGENPRTIISTGFATL